MPDDNFSTIRDTPLGQCIGATILDITADETDEFLADPENKNRVFLHLSNGETIFASLGTEHDPGRVGLLGTEDDENLGEPNA